MQQDGEEFINLRSEVNIDGRYACATCKEGTSVRTWKVSSLPVEAVTHERPRAGGFLRRREESR